MRLALAATRRCRRRRRRHRRASPFVWHPSLGDDNAAVFFLLLFRKNAEAAARSTRAAFAQLASGERQT